MSSEIPLSCNFNDCSKLLLDSAYVTSCKHIFCTEHGEKIDCRSHSATQKCPVCAITLDSQYDLIRTDLKPNDQYKSIILNGLSPNQIMDITTRALNFYTFQLKFMVHKKERSLKNNTKQKEQSMEAHLKSSTQQLRELHNQLDAQIRETGREKYRNMQLVNEIRMLQIKLEEIKRENVRVTEVTSSMRNPNPTHPLMDFNNQGNYCSNF